VAALTVAALQPFLIVLTHPSRRQLLTTGRKNPPPELKAHLTQKTFDKAQAYSRDKLMYSSFKTVYNWCVQYAFIRLEVHKWAWDLTASWMEALGWAQSYVVSSKSLSMVVRVVWS
jgi:STE24 endopeptidase